AVDSIQRSFTQVARILQVDENVECMKRTFANSVQAWLLVFENADDRSLDQIRHITTVHDSTFGTIQVPAEESNTEETMIEVSARGGYDIGNLLRWYCSQADAFIIAFSMNSKPSFESIRKFKDGIVEASTALPYSPRLETSCGHTVTLPEAVNRAAKLWTTYFPVQASSQSYGPIYLLAS
ncbi:hypothetical protein LTR72_012109, partial [Exophiala xenobiotica]